MFYKTNFYNAYRCISQLLLRLACSIALGLGSEAIFHRWKKKKMTKITMNSCNIFSSIYSLLPNEKFHEEWKQNSISILVLIETIPFTWLSPISIQFHKSKQPWPKSMEDKYHSHQWQWNTLAGVRWVLSVWHCILCNPNLSFSNFLLSWINIEGKEGKLGDLEMRFVTCTSRPP